MQAKDFKVGDRVRVADVNEGDLNWTRGLVGTVVPSRYDEGALVCVQFSVADAIGRGHHGGKSYPAPEETHTRWFILKKHLTVVETPKAIPTVASDLKLTPQAKTVLAHMKSRGSISPMEAMIGHGISRLASCIHEIRHRAGYAVNTAIRQDEGGHKYARYSLVDALH